MAHALGAYSSEPCPLEALIHLDSWNGKEKNSSSGAIPPRDGLLTAAMTSTIPSANAAYKSKDYWDERFAQEAAYEWLGSFADFEAHLLAPLEAIRPKAARVLVVGCGNSSLSADLAAARPLWHITSVDFSETVIARMKEAQPHLQWIVDDMTKLSMFSARSFDAVVDKAGMDALVTDEGDPWNPSPACVRDVDATMTAITRVLKPQGAFVQISFQQPHFRRKHLERGIKLSGKSWSPVSVTPVDTVGLGYFVYSAVLLDEVVVKAPERTQAVQA